MARRVRCAAFVVALLGQGGAERRSEKLTNSLVADFQDDGPKPEAEKHNGLDTPLLVTNDDLEKNESQIPLLTREHVDSSEPEEVSRCCCRGPRQDMCWRLSGDQLESSLLRYIPGVDDEAVCPKELGYRRFDRKQNGHLTEPPPQCSADYEHPAPKEITVTAYWMRHGFSCANAFSSVAKNKTRFSYYQRAKAGVKQVTMLDPPLSDYGIQQAQATGRIVAATIKKQRQDIGDEQGATEVFDRVFASPMLRAVETALLNFPTSKIRPTPYCAEEGRTLDNIPVSWDKQKNKLSEEDAARILWDVTPHDHPMLTDMSAKHDFTMFKTYFPSALDILLEKEGKVLEGGEDIPVIIVSHSHYMKSNLQCGPKLGRQPANNEVWIQKFRVNLGAWDAVLEPTSCEAMTIAEDVAAHFDWPRPPVNLCPQDVARCPEQPEDWLENTEELAKKQKQDGVQAGEEPVRCYQ